MKKFCRNICNNISSYRFFQHFNNSLWRGVIILGSGAAISQLIGIITTPIITRLYSPADFGVLGIFISLATILTVVASLRYEFAIPIPKKSITAANILILCILIIFFISILLAIIFFLLGNLIVQIFNLECIKPYFWILIISFPFFGLYQVLIYWVIRKQDYSLINWTKIQQSFGSSLAKIFFGFFSLGPLGLILGFILSNILGISSFLIALYKNDQILFSKISINELKFVTKKYRSFPIFSTPATLLYTISLQIPIFMLSFMFNISVVGWYTLAYQMVSLPVALISGSIAQAFYGETAKNVRDSPEKLKTLYLDTTKKLFFIGIPIGVMTAILTPIIFPFFFGEVWRQAGIMCIPLSIVSFSEFIFSPTNKLAIYGYNHWQLLFNIFRIATIMISFLIAHSFKADYIFTLSLYGFTVLFTYVVLFIMNIEAIERLITKTNKP